MKVNLARKPLEYIMRYADEMVKMYVEEGRILYDIAREFNIHPTTVRKVIRKKTGVSKLPILRTIYKVKEMEKLYKNGKSIKEIASYYNVQPNAIYFAFKKYGIKITKKDEKDEPKVKVNKNYKERICRWCGKKYFGVNRFYCDKCWNEKKNLSDGSWINGQPI